MSQRSDYNPDKHARNAEEPEEYMCSFSFLAY